MSTKEAEKLIYKKLISNKMDIVKASEKAVDNAKDLKDKVNNLIDNFIDKLEE